MKGLDPRVEEDGLEIGILPDVADIHMIRDAKQAVPDGAASRLSRQDVSTEINKDPVLRTIRRWVEEGYVPNKEDRKLLTPTGLSYANNLHLLKVVDGCVFHTSQEVSHPSSVYLPLCTIRPIWLVMHTC